MLDVYEPCFTFVNSWRAAQNGVFKVGLVRAHKCEQSQLKHISNTPNIISPTNFGEGGTFDSRNFSNACVLPHIHIYMRSIVRDRSCHTQIKFQCRQHSKWLSLVLESWLATDLESNAHWWICIAVWSDPCLNLWHKHRWHTLSTATCINWLVEWLKAESVAWTYPTVHKDHNCTCPRSFQTQHLERHFDLRVIKWSD